MILMPHVTVEVFPKTKVLTQGTVTAAGHVAKDPVELEILPVTTLLHIWEFASVIVGHE